MLRTEHKHTAAKSLYVKHQVGPHTGNSHKGVDGDRLWVLRQGCQLVDEPHPVLGPLA